MYIFTGKGNKREIPSSGNHRNIRWKTVTPQIILCPFGRNRTVFWKDKEKEKKNGSNNGPPIERDYYQRSLLAVLSGTKTPSERLRVTKIINKANDTELEGYRWVISHNNKNPVSLSTRLIIARISLSQSSLNLADEQIFLSPPLPPPYPKPPKKINNRTKCSFLLFIVNGNICDDFFLCCKNL